MFLDFRHGSFDGEQQGKKYSALRFPVHPFGSRFYQLFDPIRSLVNGQSDRSNGLFLWLCRQGQRQAIPASKGTTLVQEDFWGPG